VKTACPTCGAEVDFRYDDSFVRVCTFCRSAVLRTDRGIESLGKTADLVDLPSPIALFAEGRYRGLGFMVVGRTQLRHQAGGLWQEWYAKMDDGRWGWLAEAQGRYYLTFEAPGAAAPLGFDAAQPGAQATIAYEVPRTLTVHERADAQYVSAEGEIPFRFQPGAWFRMVDLGDAEGRFATIDYGITGANEAPAVYVGRQATLAELSLTGGERAPATGGQQIASRRLACPQCDGALELRAPDAALRVACPYCGALLDANAGVLSILRTLEPGQRGRSPIPLGATCTFEGTTLTAIGHVQRVAIIDGMHYPFDEVLLHAPSLGFRWLVQSDGHWSYVQPVQPGAVETTPGGVRYEGVGFRPFQHATLEVERVVGEFYWRVEIGEDVQSADYIAPPAMLSSEQSADEVTWSLGRYVSHRELERAFDGKVVAGSATGIAPNQPPLLAGLGAVIGVLALAFAVLYVGLQMTADNRVVTRQSATFAPPELPAADPTADPLAPVPVATSLVWFSEPFQLADGDNVAIDLDTSVSNSWVSVGGDLIHDGSGEFEMFDRDIEYYFGYDGGESWSEGSQRATVTLGPQPGGTYVLRLEATGPDASPPRIDVAIRQDVVVGRLALFALIALFVPGLVLGLVRYLYERKRWSQSDLAPLIYRAGGDDE
jgi:hypothetical protein